MANQQMVNYASSSSSSSCVPPLKKHDVFLSFRGEDTHHSFTSLLYDALIQTKLETYIDNRLPKGDEISQALIEAIEESQVSVVIFSENYATSKWCLDEIAKIIECKEDRGQVVIPMFYKVDPSHVRKQQGSFHKAFAEHERDLKITNDKVQKWRAALTKAANLAGWDSQSYRTEAEFIKDIVKDVLHKLNLIYPIELKGLIGIEGNYARIESLLEIGTREVRVIGIWGMGGIGKTTLAIALHAKLFSQFEGHCFLANVREQSEKHGIDDLRSKLFCELLPGENLHALVPHVESHFIMRSLRRKKVFIVLDDVASSEQLEDLISDFDCFGPGSRVIVTTRDKHILSHVHGIYEVEELNDRDSLQLFCLNAFREKHPKNGFEELSESVIAYCKGNPLALKVLGARLRSRSEQAWKSELRKLQKIPNVKIYNVLKLSFDDLDRTEQDIFLDIACFLKGEDRDHIISLLEACNFFPAIGIEVLADKSLITISGKNTIEMHDLIQEMGWNIVQQESVKDPERRSRLWDPEEVYDVLKYNRGTEAIEGITLDVSKIEDLHLSVDSFTKMTNIRFLKFYHGKGGIRCKIYLPKNGLQSLSDKLRYLHWEGYCLESLPSTFSAKFLVELSMPYGNVEKLWDGVQNLVNLKGIDLRFCENLVEVPDLSMATNLKELTLTQCRSLRQVHASILSLPKLQALDLEGCTEIESLQTDVHLKSLQDLRLSNCSSLKEFSVSSAELQRLLLDGTHIQELPSSVWRCEKLRLINVQRCDNLVRFGDKLSYDPRTASFNTLVLSRCKQLNTSNLHVILDGLRSLTWLELENCCNLRTLPDSIDLLSSLKCLKLSRSNVESLPASIKNLLMLRSLYLDHCMKLVSLPELPQFLSLLSAVNCKSLVTNFTQLNIPFQLKRGLEECTEFFLPGTQVPDWFSFHGEGASVTIPHLPHAGLRGFIFCLVLSQSPPRGKYINVECFIYKNSERIAGKVTTSLGSWHLVLDHVFLWFVDITKGGDDSIHRRIQKGGAFDPSNISFEWTMEGIKGCGVYPIYASERGYSLKEKWLELVFGHSSRDIVGLIPDSSNDMDELQVKGSNHDNEDDQTKKLQQVMHQTITTDLQHVKVDLNENSSCHSFVAEDGTSLEKIVIEAPIIKEKTLKKSTFAPVEKKIEMTKPTSTQAQINLSKKIIEKSTVDGSDEDLPPTQKFPIKKKKRSTVIFCIEHNDLDVVDISSSHEPLAEPVEASMLDVNKEPTPKVGSTLQKMNPIELGQGTPKDTSVHLETSDPQDKGTQSQNESSLLEKTTEQHEETIPIEEEEVSSEHEHNDPMDFDQPRPVIQNEESSEEQATNLEGLEKEKEKTPKPSPMATASKSSSYQVADNPLELELEGLEEKDIFDILTKWLSGYSASSKASEASQNKSNNKEAFQQAYNYFHSLAFDENFSTNLRKAEYKKDIEDAIKRMEYFDNEFTDNQRDVMEQFLDISMLHTRSRKMIDNVWKLLK